VHWLTRVYPAGTLELEEAKPIAWATKAGGREIPWGRTTEPRGSPKGASARGL